MMFVLFVGSTSEYRKGRQQDSFEHSVCACMEGKGGREGKEAGMPTVGGGKHILYSQERDASGGLADAQPGTLGLYVTTGEHPASSGLDVVLDRRGAVIGGGERG